MTYSFLSHRLVRFSVLLVTVTMAVLLCCSCTSTVTSHRVVDTVASFDGNVQTSGLLGFTADGSGILTPHARDRYNALVQVYGKRFAPALQLDAGVTRSGSIYLIDAEHLVKFGTMNLWRKGRQ